MAFHFGVMPWSTYRLASLENPYELVVWQRLYPCVADEQADGQMQALRTGAGIPAVEGL